jgi:hypothetical protein
MLGSVEEYREPCWLLDLIKRLYKRQGKMNRKTKIKDCIPSFFTKISKIKESMSSSNPWHCGLHNGSSNIMKQAKDSYHHQN